MGYLQRIDLAALQQSPEDLDLDTLIMSMPGAFVTPQRILARAICAQRIDTTTAACLEASFRISSLRTFDDDPRFGLVVLSEIASKALSPAVNDPGTAIHIIGAFVRLFSQWAGVCCQRPNLPDEPVCFDRLSMPKLVLEDLLDDALQAIGRDGAAFLEVGLRLQNGLSLISLLPVPGIQEATRSQARLALSHGEAALRLTQDAERLRKAAAWILLPGQGEPSH